MVFYYFGSNAGSVVVNFTLVFLKGNKSVNELVQILESSVKNGTVHLLAVEKETLRLTLPGEFLCCIFV